MSFALPPLWKLQKREITETVENFAESEVAWEETLDGRVLPAYFELSFGGKRSPGTNDDPHSTRAPFALADGVLISGRIDRVDTAPDGTYIVVDYKLGGGSGWKDALEGTDIQLPVYIQAAGKILEREGAAGAAGGCYLSLKDFSRTKGLWRALYNGRYYVLSKRVRSLLDEYAWNDVIRTVNEHVVDYVNRIRAGDYRLIPKRCEDYCDFAGICRFEEWRIYGHRRMLSREGSRLVDPKHAGEQRGRKTALERDGA
jgi:ATP-dependent helicase/DNAse subunit B